MIQKIISNRNNYGDIDKWIDENDLKHILLVCSSSISRYDDLVLKFEKISEGNIDIVKFSDFVPNPKYESVVEGVRLFRKAKCEGIIAVGGGSTIDVAKCIKIYSNMEVSDCYFNHEIVNNTIPFMVIPTTAGTGSEATKYAVIYYEGEKQSITNEYCIPDTVLFDSSLLQSLPLYQKKSTMMDALSHAIESMWSINSTLESQKYSRLAIKSIMKHMHGYLSNTNEGNEGMLIAANIAGKAINITQTTAGHAMCYKLTSLCGLSHGHAAALCNINLYPWMIKNIDQCIDTRGKTYEINILNDIGRAIGANNAIDGAQRLRDIYYNLELDTPKIAEECIDEMVNGINIDRLNNFPFRLDRKAIYDLYHDIVEVK